MLSANIDCRIAGFLNQLFLKNTMMKQPHFFMLIQIHKK